MPSIRRIGKIEIISRKNREIGFKWKISQIISKLGKVGDKYRSPFVKALGTKFSVIISTRKSDRESATKILIGIVRINSQTNSQTRVHYTVSVKKADDVEEEIIGGDIIPAIDSSDVKKFQKASKFMIRMSQIAPSGALIVICKLWTDERHSVRGKTVVSRKMQTSNMSNSCAREVACANPDIKGWSSFTDFIRTCNTASTSTSAENERRPPECYSSSSQMTWDTASCAAESEIPASECYSSGSHMSWKTSSCRDEDASQLSADSRGRQSSCSQMSLNTTSSVTDEKRQSTSTGINRKSTNGAKSFKNNVTNEVTKESEIEILRDGMLFISKNIHEIVQTEGWQNFLLSDPLRANDLLKKALGALKDKS